MKIVFKKFYKQNIFLIFIISLHSLGLVFSSILLTFATDAVVNLNVRDFILWDLSIVFLWSLIISISYFETIYRTKLIEDMGIYLRNKASRYYSKSTYDEFYGNDTDRYLTRLSNDVRLIQENSFNKIYELVGYILRVTFSIIALFSYHYSLLIAVLFLTYLMFFSSKFKSKDVAVSMGKYANEYEYFLGKLSELIKGFKIYQALNLQDQFRFKINNLGKALAEKKLNLEKDRAKVHSISSSVHISSSIIIDLITGILAINQIVTIGALSTTGTLSSNIFYALSEIINLITDINSTQPLFSKPEFNNNDESKSHLKKEKLDTIFTIKIDNLFYEISDNKIINDFNYTFEKGKKYCIIGDSGSGKTTLLNIISSRLTSSAGEVLYNDRVASTWNINDIRKNILYLEQTPFIFNTTVIENITMGESFSTNEINRAIIDSGLEVYDHDNWFEKKCGEDGNKLSGGQKQRISLARALIRKPSVILFDESTSNLDRKSTVYIENKLLSNKELTVIMVTHNLLDSSESMIDEKIYI